MSDSNLLDRISKLRGSINNHKQAKEITSNAPIPAYSTRARGRGRGSYRGYSTRLGGIKNKTLIVDHKASNSDYVSQITTGGKKWINRAVYEEEFQRQSMSKEEKQKAHLDAKARIQRQKLEIRISRNRVKLDLCDRCLINGDLYSIARFGAKLVVLNPPRDLSTKELSWNGYTYTKLKNGNLKLKNQKVFLKEPCRYFQKTGECSRGDTCKYTHNKSKVALCRRYIRSQCTKEDCKMAHEFTEFNTPICHFYLKQSCRNENCPFLHVNPELELVCRPFAIGGYCFRGKNCKFIHTFECPDFQLTRECPRGKACRLIHSEKDNLDAKLMFNTLDPEYYQLPNLTELGDIHNDPRIQTHEVKEEDYYSDDEDEDEDEDQEDFDPESELSIQAGENDSLKVNADFIHF